MTKDKFDEKHATQGILRVIRTPKGEVLGSYEITENDPRTGKPRRMGGLLNGGFVYLLLVDQKPAQERYRLEIVGQDASYTYLTVKPRQEQQLGVCFREGRVVLMNQGTDKVPQNMPRQFWYTGGSSEFTFDIQTWRLNGPEAPKIEEFKRPEDRPGWTVLDSPFHKK